MVTKTPDVIVVGCGPVGVMAALRCTQRGLRVVALDKSTEVFPLPRAIGMDDETQDVFVRAGMDKSLRAHSQPLLGAEFADAAGNRVVGIELPPGTVGSLGHPPQVMFDQPALEYSLRQAAADAGVELRLGAEVIAVRTGQDQAEVALASGDRLSARWVIAADGAKSAMRDLLGIGVDDQGFDQPWLVVDTMLLDESLDLPTVAHQRCDPARVCTFVPGVGRHRRWEFRMLPGEDREHMLQPDTIAELLAPWANRDQVEITRSAVYRFHAVVASRFRQDSAFLAGDAAHQMPPFNGQGMCSGIRDAENLSWKLAAVHTGTAGDDLLDTYDEERRPHARLQVEHSVDAGLLMNAIANDGEIALESGYGQRPFPKLTGSLFGDAGTSPLVGGLLPAPKVGPDPFHQADPNSWVTLTPDGPTPADAYPGVLTEGLTIRVRPDRYVASVSAP